MSLAVPLSDIKERSEVRCFVASLIEIFITEEMVIHSKRVSIHTSWGLKLVAQYGDQPLRPAPIKKECIVITNRHSNRL